MGRRRGQTKGYLYPRSGSWILQWREDIRDEAGNICRVKRSEVIAACAGPGAVSKREARRIARDEYLSKLDKRSLRPSSTMTVAAFVEQKFVTQHVEKKKHGGRKHYEYLLRKHIIPALGKRRLCDVGTDDVESVIYQKRREGFSGQTLLHIRNAISAVFRHAKRLHLYCDENPAWGVEVGEVRHEKRPTYGWDQAQVALRHLRPPYRHMAILSLQTSMSVAEIAGLRRRWLNSTENIKQVDGEVLPPHTVAVRENYYEGKWGSLKTGKRRRNLAITPELATELRKQVERSPFKGDEYPVFCSRVGTPIDAHNVTNRVFKPLSVKIGFPVNWHAFRRAHSSFAGELGMPVEDRVATMGHADAHMTLYYSVADVERRREIPRKIMEQLTKPRGAKRKLLRIRTKKAGA